MKDHPELTKTKGSYVEQLNVHNEEINQYYNNRSTTVDQMKELVRSIIVGTNDKDLDHKSPATKLFLLHLSQKRTKNDVLSLVWSARMKGDNLGVI